MESLRQLAPEKRSTYTVGSRRAGAAEFSGPRPWGGVYGDTPLAQLKGASYRSPLNPAPHATRSPLDPAPHRANTPTLAYVALHPPHSRRPLRIKKATDVFTSVDIMQLYSINPQEGTSTMEIRLEVR